MKMKGYVDEIYHCHNLFSMRKSLSELYSGDKASQQINFNELGSVTIQKGEKPEKYSKPQRNQTEIVGATIQRGKKS